MFVDGKQRMVDDINDFCNTIDYCDDCPAYEVCRSVGGFGYETDAKAVSDAWGMICSSEKTEKNCKETVNHPEHYQGPNECIKVMEAMFGREAVKHFCMCNAFKYRFRADKKNGEEDIKKAEWYETYLIKMGGIDNGNE